MRAFEHERENPAILVGCAVAFHVCVGPLFGRARYTKTQTGTAVFYSDTMQGRGVSLKGEKYDKDALTAAHKRVAIDLSRKAAEEIDMVHSGHAKVELELLQTK